MQPQKEVMVMIRKKFERGLKAKVAVEALRGKKTTT